MKRNEKDIKKLEVSESVENYIILSSVTLSASFAILLNDFRIESRLMSFCILATIFCFLSTLALCLWHKIRFNKRSSLFEREKNKIIDKYAKEIAFVLDNSKFNSSSANKDDDPAYKIIYSFCKNLGSDFNEAGRKYFSKPLDERCAKINFIFDLIARKFRYPIFGTGLLFYFLSILFKYFTK